MSSTVEKLAKMYGYDNDDEKMVDIKSVGKFYAAVVPGEDSFKTRTQHWIPIVEKEELGVKTVKDPKTGKKKQVKTFKKTYKRRPYNCPGEDVCVYCRLRKVLKAAANIELDDVVLEAGDYQTLKGHVLEEKEYREGEGYKSMIGYESVGNIKVVDAKKKRGPFIMPLKFSQGRKFLRLVENSIKDFGQTEGDPFHKDGMLTIFSFEYNKDAKDNKMKYMVEEASDKVVKALNFDKDEIQSIIDQGEDIDMTKFDTDVADPLQLSQILKDTLNRELNLSEEQIEEIFDIEEALKKRVATPKKQKEAEEEPAEEEAEAEVEEEPVETEAEEEAVETETEEEAEEEPAKKRVAAPKKQKEIEEEPESEEEPVEKEAEELEESPEEEAEEELIDESVTDEIEEIEEEKPKKTSKPDGSKKKK